ncbi:hypothetical protein CORC01_13598 [Colletotrichum orchidophilum]|uniref:FAD-binding domain-containing protein n=1 Tax=Colletotrichum orchidophilum TaxID=1209926 RepID=A0A1G4APS9_9PEZI|nr:uncharacterized protein CORC01_13598 [Colletotrichum orchidophilum]OHE91116.1 hypothetical protein CORC01_13598 [Colletotrichum orchidophilum]
MAISQDPQRDHQAETKTAKPVPTEINFKTNTIVDGVLRYPPIGVKAVIVGGGIAGLFAAVECWRKGLEVVVLEKADEVSMHGDVIGVGPSALSTLQNYPTMVQEYNDIAYSAHWRFCFENGEPFTEPFEYEYNDDGLAQHAAYPLRIKSIIKRSDLAKMLAGQCERFGIPIHFGVSIAEYEEDDTTATAISEDGRRFSGDVVIAADGIGTKSHAVVLGYPTRANSTGFVKFRAVVPTSSLAHIPIVQKIMNKEQRPEVRLYMGGSEGRHHAVTILPDVVCYASAVKDNGGASESWSGRVDGAYVLSQMDNLDKIDPLIVDGFKALSSDKSIVHWLLAMRNPQGKWVSKGGRIVQAGDSAHSFLPTSGSGATTAIESSLTIAECLRLGGSNVSLATKVYQLLRYQRVCILQQTGLRNRQQMSSQPSSDILRQGKWHWAHQPETYARDNFSKARAHIENDAPFENTNLPPGHKFKEWSLEDEMAKEQAGIFSADLKTNGDWGLV